MGVKREKFSTDTFSVFPPGRTEIMIFDTQMKTATLYSKFSQIGAKICELQLIVSDNVFPSRGTDTRKVYGWLP